MANPWLDFEVPWALEGQHLAWQKTMRDFCQDVVAPGAAERSIEGRFDPEIAKAVGALGVYGLLVPEEFGGGGADLRSMCIAVEQLAVVDSSLAVTAHVAAVNVALLHRFLADRPDDAARLLPRMCTGEHFVSFGLTEPSGGSDAGNISTRAERTGDGWVLNGSKQFITNAGTPFSRYVTVFAATGFKDTGGLAVSAFLVPLDTPGVTVAKGYEKLGWRSSDTHPLFFDDVQLPADALLGDEGRGYRQALELLTWARIPIAAMSAGLAHGCLEECLAFTASRTSFGVTLAEHQSVAFRIADIAAAAATARLVTYDAAWKYDQGRDIRAEAAMAKLVASELANKVAYQATQLHGGYGFIQESAVTRHYQDARILTIGEGTSEIQRLLIARGLGIAV